jgi:UDP-xylose/UDP-N-acetylglucosamine transporter B4
MLGVIGWNRALNFIGFTVSGCCLNVYSFEKLLRINSQITTLLTFTQYLFIFISMSIYLKYIGYWNKQNDMKKKAIKYSDTLNFQYIFPVISQTLTANLSNYVFQYNLSMPTHIILRSSSATITIFLGWIIWGKKYSLDKIFASILIGIGTILFTFDVKNLQDNSNTSNNYIENEKLIGILLLLSATIINCLTSLYKERIYQNKNTKLNWLEVLYYNYFYGLLLYSPFINTIFKEFENIKIDKNMSGLFTFNWITQLCCIIGVNILVFKVSALSLSIILLIRRFLSLFFSIYFFQIPIGTKGYIGIFVLTLGTLIYSFGDRLNKNKRKII